MSATRGAARIRRGFRDEARFETDENVSSVYEPKGDPEACQASGEARTRDRFAADLYAQSDPASRRRVPESPTVLRDTAGQMPAPLRTDRRNAGGLSHGVQGLIAMLGDSDRKRAGRRRRPAELGGDARACS